jgi:[acyl-carrier-protein] S-malonyltransferase
LSKIALFPGQGIAAPVVRDALAAAPQVRDEAGEALGVDLAARLEEAARMDHTPPTTLMQPAIFAASIALWRSTPRSDFSFAAGHSLGEYAALVAAGALTFSDAIGVLRVRSQAMEDVSKTSPGGMGAVLRLELQQVKDIVDQAGVGIANNNAPGQIVVSGPTDGLAATQKLTEELGGKYVPLEIVGPFHTDAVAPAGPPVRAALDAIEIREPQMPVISNATGEPFEGVEDIKRLLVLNLTVGVRWRESLEWAWEQGVRTFEDIGPGQVVGKLARQNFGAFERSEKPTDVD